MEEVKEGEEVITPELAPPRTNSASRFKVSRSVGPSESEVEELPPPTTTNVAQPPTPPEPSPMAPRRHKPALNNNLPPSGPSDHSLDSNLMMEPGRYSRQPSMLTDLKDRVEYHPETFFGGGRSKVNVDFLKSSLSHYSAAIASAPSDPDEHQSANKMGTLFGVYLPTIQNVLGVLMFIRLAWVVGTAGVVQGFVIVFMCCSCTFLTAISMSAVATNGKIPAGGSYYMISRSLGPEFGGAVGVLFFLATTVNGSMEILGAIEILIIYMIPQMALFGDVTDPAVKFNNFRFYGSILLLVIVAVVFGGVRVVNKFAAAALVCFLISLLSVYVGILVNMHGSSDPSMCMLGQRILVKEKLQGHNCSDELKHHGPLVDFFCHENKRSHQEECSTYLRDHNVSQRPVVLGLASDTILRNTPSWYTYKTGSYLTDSYKTKDTANFGEDPENFMVKADATSGFVILVGIFFPTVTGIMAGSNRSGDLKDAQKSIPTGTILACLTTSTVYLSLVFLLGGSVDSLFLRDKFGESLGGRLVMGVLSWPSEWVFLIGALVSTIASGMHSLMGAPRLLQAIAKDELIPFLRPMMVTSENGEPRRALFLTWAICQLCVFIGNLDEINPLLSCFFLMCYGFINLACALQTLLRTPNWRPRFRYYHWALSLTGLGLCVTIMFMSSWFFALCTIAVAVAIYKYIEFNGAKKEWGDGIRGLALSAARFALLQVEEGEPHIKNWRPQILVCVKLDRNLKPKYKQLMSFASQLKTGKGLIMPVTVLNGEYVDMVQDAKTAKKSMKEAMNVERLKGFSEVVVADCTLTGLTGLLQTAGIGGLKPNTVIMGWPSGWRSRQRSEPSWKVFVEMVRRVAATRMALIVPKGIQFYPDSTDKLAGNMDVWWIVHDGGLLMLLPFLLQRHRTWQHCKLRIFTVAQLEDNSIQMKVELKQFLYNVRIDAEVEIVEMDNTDISAYTYERTVRMEQRSEYLNELKMNRIDSRMCLEELVVQYRHPAHHGPDKAMDRPEFFAGRRESSAMTDLEAEGSRYSPNEKFKRVKPTEENVLRMHTAVRLNEIIRSKSSEARLVVVNLPNPPKEATRETDANYLEFLEVMTEGLQKVMLVRGGGHEVITIYS